MPSYYVSPRGSDQNDGLSPVTAWQTLDKASRSLYQPGDVIALEGGQTHTGQLSLTANSGYLLRVTAYGSSRAKVLGSVRVMNTDCKVDSLDVDAQGQQVSAIYFGNNTPQGGRTIMPGCEVSSCSVANCAATADGTAGGRGVEFACWGASGFDRPLVRDVEAYNCQIAGVCLNGYDGDGTRAYTFWHPIVERVNAHDNQGVPGAVVPWPNGAGIIVWGASGGTVTGCTTTNNGQYGNLNASIYLGYCENVMVHDNNVGEQYRAPNTPDGEGIQLDVRCYGCVVMGNTIKNIALCGISVYGEVAPNSSNGNVVKGNTVTDPCRDVPNDPTYGDINVSGNATGNAVLDNVCRRTGGTSFLTIGAGNMDSGNDVG